MMKKKKKILLPFKKFNNTSIYAEKVSGGIEMFAKQIFDHVVDYEIIPIEYTENDTRKSKVQPRILSAIRQYNPDLILINYDTTTITSGITDKIDIPIMWIIHNLGDMISKKPFADTFDKFRSGGNTIYMMSEYQLATWKKIAKNFKISDDLEIDGLINSSFDRFDVAPDDDKIYDAIVIGRTYPGKDNYFLNRKYLSFKGELSDIPKTLLVTNTPTEPDCIEYYKQSTKNGVCHYTEYNLPYTEVIDRLRHSKVLVSTCPRESWGIVVLEALCNGVPVLAVTQGGRGSIHDIVADPTHYDITSAGENVNQIIEKINTLASYSPEKRREISEMTKQKHSKAMWLMNFSEQVEFTILKYQTHKSTDKFPLEEFFGND